MTEYYAHSENDLNEKHSLSKHLQQTAELMESFACKQDYKTTFKITGLLHDLGKYQPEFQNYLVVGGKRGSVPHSSWGAGYARILRFIEASIAIDGHHKGLPDISDWKNDTESFYRDDIPNFKNIINTFLNDTGINKEEIKPNTLSFTDLSQKRQRELFIRYLFSALTDSDWLSTEEHFDATKHNIRQSIDLPIDLMINKLEEEFSKKPSEEEINQLRNSARYQVIQKSDLPCGFYSLALPTGMGKTLTSMAWALRHAKRNQLKRIIIVLPYINIIDQTANIFKNIFGEEWILEHHSNYNNDNSVHSENCSKEQELKYLSCENWEYPIIITTTVQFFESLFSKSPSKCRKIHNIAESVVIFDEVQVLPKDVISPTLQMLEDVQTIMRSSFLFCTATQPAFEKRPGFEGISKIISLVENTSVLYEKTKRVDYNLLNNLEPVDYEYLLRYVMNQNSSVLIIFNTKKTSLEFYNYTKLLKNWDKKYYLSTLMCPSHRKDIIKNITKDLKEKRNILVVSTQLIEAGVDFDFPVVFRAMAPLEAVIQSAGRCNRENRLGFMGGKVYLFKPEDNSMPDKTYKACTGYTEEIIKKDINQLYGHEIFTEYYANILNLYVDPDKYNIIEARKQFNFETVNDAYHIINNPTDSLFIYRYNKDSQQLFKEIENKKYLSRDDYRRMQMYSVPVYQNFIERHDSECELTKQGFYIWNGEYDDQTGITLISTEVDRWIL